MVDPDRGFLSEIDLLPIEEVLGTRQLSPRIIDDVVI